MGAGAGTACPARTPGWGRMRAGEALWAGAEEATGGGPGGNGKARPPVRLKRIAEQGFGDGQNAYAHSMAWYRGYLYVGTTRNNLCLIKGNPQRDTMRRWPVPCPDDVYTLDMRAQIWRLDPATGRWEHVHSSPLVEGTNGRSVPRDIGYRKMLVFQGPEDDAPALYVCSMSWLEAPGSYFLRSTDGVRFEPVSTAGLADPSASSFRAVVEFDGRLFTSPAGEGRAFYSARAPVVLESRNPATGRWTPVSQPGFGDPDNTAIVDLAVLGDSMYAGTLNPRTGFQVWKTNARGKPPYRWKQVIQAGAYRGNLNEGILTFRVFGDALYAGGHISMGGHDRKHFVGPGAAELIRIHPDDSWDLLVGDPRQTPEGFKHPLSDMSAGFDNPFCGYLWSMAVHDGWLYAGTFDSSVFAYYAHLSRMPLYRRMRLVRFGVENAVRKLGGCELWRSRDGEGWEPVTRNGFGNRYNYGVRTMVSTPHGLFLGTANPFGPQVAQRTQADGWEYVDNPRGGLEVWRANEKVRRPQPERKESGMRVETNGEVADQINHGYDNVMFQGVIEEYYDHSDFANWGYWDEGASTQREASENLMERLLELIPRKKGRILDVACGKGATTRHLLRYYDPEQVVGINISEKQLERCRENAPGCTFELMDATSLDFPGRSFDNVICVEAAFHFDTREKFFRQANRVLKPGGRLVLSDILFRPGAESRSRSLNARNWVEDPEAYGEIMTRAGFEDVRVIDATQECWRGFDAHRTRYALELIREGKLPPPVVRFIRTRRTLQRLATRFYVLAVGRKP